MGSLQRSKRYIEIVEHEKKLEELIKKYKQILCRDKHYRCIPVPDVATVLRKFKNGAVYTLEFEDCNGYEHILISRHENKFSEDKQIIKVLNVLGCGYDVKFHKAFRSKLIHTNVSTDGIHSKKLCPRLPFQCDCKVRCRQLIDSVIYPKDKLWKDR